jgi:thiosulfate sulfurtransferase
MTEIKNITVEELKEKMQHEKVIIADVRREEDFAEKHIPGAVYLDQYNFNDFVANTDKDATIVICCYRGNRSRKMIPRLLHKGFKEVYNLTGGLTAWLKV